MIATKLLAVAVAVLVSFAIGVYMPSAAPGQTTTGTTSTSCTTWSTSTTSTTTSTTTVANQTQGTFTYAPHAPAKVLSVAASTYSGGGGTGVSFLVLFENVGNGSIYTDAGCGSSLVATVDSNSSVIQRVDGGPRCLCAEYILAITPGMNHTSSTPGCWSGYSFKLLRPGTATVHLTLFWGPGQAAQNSTSIEAKFVFGPM